MNCEKDKIGPYFIKRGVGRRERGPIRKRWRDIGKKKKPKIERDRDRLPRQSERQGMHTGRETNAQDWYAI